jgi:hypothetical protein
MRDRFLSTLVLHPTRRSVQENAEDFLAANHVAEALCFGIILNGCAADVQ